MSDPADCHKKCDGCKQMKPLERVTCSACYKVLHKLCTDCYYLYKKNDWISNHKSSIAWVQYFCSEQCFAKMKCSKPTCRGLLVNGYSRRQFIQCRNLGMCAEGHVQDFYTCGNCQKVESCEADWFMLKCVKCKRKLCAGCAQIWAYWKHDPTDQTIRATSSHQKFFSKQVHLTCLPCFEAYHWPDNFNTEKLSLNKKRKKFRRWRARAKQVVKRFEEQISLPSTLVEIIMSYFNVTPSRWWRFDSQL